jgi:hypothetical protein
MKKLLTICLMLLGVVAQAQNFAITATTEASIRKNIVKGNAANYGLGVINDTLKLVGLTTKNVIFTGTIGKSGVGLGNVDNTSDANKPVSTATQTALNLKANLASPTFTGTVSGITKAMVGLSNVDNTSDASKPISTATQTALDAKQATLSGTGFVKSTAGTISYDNSTYLTTSTAASSYLPISNPTATGTLTAPTIANSLGANFATTSGFVGINTITNAGYKLDVNGTLRTVNDAYFATTSGSVGIGTPAPSSILHTIGSIQTSSTSSASSSYANRFNNIIFSRFDIPTSFTNVISNSWSGTATDQTMNFEIGSGSSTRVTAMTLVGNGNVGIGVTAPAASAILDITSTTKGVLFPRMTTTQINAITSPANGLTVYNTTVLALCFYDGTGWKKVSHSAM